MTNTVDYEPIVVDSTTEVYDKIILGASNLILNASLDPAQINYVVDCIINKVALTLEIAHDELREHRDNLDYKINVSQIAIKSLMSKLPQPQAKGS